jgi:hypothetical protein
MPRCWLLAALSAPRTAAYDTTTRPKGLPFHRLQLRLLGRSVVINRYAVAGTCVRTVVYPYR